MRPRSLALTEGTHVSKRIETVLAAAADEVGEVGVGAVALLPCRDWALRGGARLRGGALAEGRRHGRRGGPEHGRVLRVGLHGGDGEEGRVVGRRGLAVEQAAAGGAGREGVVGAVARGLGKETGLLLSHHLLLAHVLLLLLLLEELLLLLLLLHHLLLLLLAHVLFLLLLGEHLGVEGVVRGELGLEALVPAVVGHVDQWVPGAHHAHGLLLLLAVLAVRVELQRVVKQRCGVGVLLLLLALGVLLLAQLDGLLQIVVLLDTLRTAAVVVRRRVHARLDGALQLLVVVTVTACSATVAALWGGAKVFLATQTRIRNVAEHTVAHGTALAALGAQTLLVLEQVGNVLCLLTDIVADVFPLVVDIDKLFERLDNVQVVFKVDDNVLAAGVQAVVEQRQSL